MTEVVEFLSSKKGQSYIVYGVTLTVAGGAAYAIYKRFRDSRITVPCFGCDPGGTWYKCAPGTGAGSEQCALFKDLGKAIDDIEDKLKKLVDAISILEKAILDPFADAEDIFKDITAKIGTVVFTPLKKSEEFVGNALSNLPGCSVGELNKLIGTFDPCAMIRNIAMGVLSEVDKVIDFLNGQLNLLGVELTKAMKTIIKPVEDALLQIVQALMKPWKAVADEIGNLISELSALLKALKSGITIYLQGVVYDILDVGVVSVGTLLGILAASSAMMFVGGIVGNYTLAKKLIALPSEVVSVL